MNAFETVRVNEPSGFEPLKFYRNYCVQTLIGLKSFTHSKNLA